MTFEEIIKVIKECKPNDNLRQYYEKEEEGYIHNKPFDIWFSAELETEKREYFSGENDCEMIDVSELSLVDLGWIDSEGDIQKLDLKVKKRLEAQEAINELFINYFN